jgi:hypothetical protein
VSTGSRRKPRECGDAEVAGESCRCVPTAERACMMWPRFLLRGATTTDRDYTGLLRLFLRPTWKHSSCSSRVLNVTLAGGQ